MNLVCSFANSILKFPYLLKIATLILMFIIDSFLFEYVWRKPIQNGNLAVIITILFILAIITAVLDQFGIVEKIPFVGNNIIFKVIFSTVFALLTFIFAIIFGIINVLPSNKEKICNPITGTFFIYWQKDHFGDKKYLEWKYEHMNPFDVDLYFMQRTIIPGACVLCFFSCLSVLYGILLFKLHKNDNNDTINDMNQPINNENNTSYTSISLKVSI